MFGKRYYLCLKFIGGKVHRDVWHCKSKNIPIKGYDFVMPLPRKPKDVKILEDN